ncbi:MAG: hypothetical protein HUU37_05950 [Bdellovibrionales bacterium]|nr:hypothetical protein [Bdellovibrionales bacterium]
MKLWLLLGLLALAGCSGPSMPVEETGKATGGASQEEGAVGPAFLADIKPLFQTRCAACHGPGKMNPKDWLDYSVALAGKDLIFQRVVVQKNMPLGAPLEARELELVAAWVKAGAPEGGGEKAPAPQPEPAPAPAPADRITFTKHLRPLFELKCAMCHAAGGPFPNWLVYSVAFEKRDRLVTRVVVQKDMPPPGIAPLSDDERKLIADWVSSGALE